MGPLFAIENAVGKRIYWLDLALFTRFEIQHGMICALGYVTADCVLRTPNVSHP